MHVYLSGVGASYLRLVQLMLLPPALLEPSIVYPFGTALPVLIYSNLSYTFYQSLPS